MYLEPHGAGAGLLDELDSSAAVKQASRARANALILEGKSAVDQVKALLAAKEESFGTAIFDGREYSLEEAQNLAERVKKEAMEALRQLNASRAALDAKLVEADGDVGLAKAAEELRTFKTEVQNVEQRLHDLMTQGRKLPAEAEERANAVNAAVEAALASIASLCSAQGEGAQAFCAAIDADGDGTLSAAELAALIDRLEPPVPAAARVAVEQRLGGAGASIDILHGIIARRYRCVATVAMLGNFSMAEKLEKVRDLVPGE